MIVSHDGIKMDPEKVNAILKWPEPTNVKQVHTFLSLATSIDVSLKTTLLLVVPWWI